MSARLTKPHEVTGAPRRRWAVMAGGLATGGSLLMTGGCAPFARDPSPGYWRPHPAVRAVAADAATREGAYLVQTVRLQAPGPGARDGLTVDLLVKRPAPVPGAPAPRGPLVLILGGHHTGREAARLIPDTRGRVVAALSYPYDGPHRPRGLVGVARAAPAVRRAALHTPTAVHVALDWLLAQPYVDPSQVEAVGASLGVPFMIVATATDPRVTRLWALHGAGRSRDLLAHNARGTVPTRPLRWLVAHAADALVAGPRLTPERWVARVSPRPFIMINAESDERLPRRDVLALYHAARAPKTLVWMPGPHVQRNRPEVVRALLDTVFARMESTHVAAAVAAAPQ